MNMLSKQNAVVLLAEDSEADRRLVQRAMRREKSNIVIQTVNDGQEAINYLTHQGSYADLGSNPRPDLILLDINMPRVDGKKVLRFIRENDDLKSIPVIILTTSQQESDISEAYLLGVNAYISKSSDVEKFFLTMKLIEEFWFDQVRLPGHISEVG